MTARSTIVALLSLLLAGYAEGQVASQQPKLSILLPANTPSDKFEVRYYLYGSFGANGGYLSPKSPSTGVVKIPLSVGGKIAKAIKLFAWTPGCQFATYDLSVQESDLQEPYTCNPLSTVMLRGEIADKRLLKKASSEIRVDYLAGWACDFFGLSDCMVPQISLGTVTADADGRFEIELPDFAHDPASSDSNPPSEFQFALRKVKTGNLIAMLDPDLNAAPGGGGLRPASSYAEPVVFNARKTNQSLSVHDSDFFPQAQHQECDETTLLRKLKRAHWHGACGFSPTDLRQSSRLRSVSLVQRR